MAVNARNNLSPESQQWARQVQEESQSSPQLPAVSPASFNSLQRQVASQAIRVQPFHFSTTDTPNNWDGSNSFGIQVSADIEPSANHAVFQGVLSLGETHNSNASIRSTYVGYNMYGELPTLLHSGQQTQIIPANNTSFMVWHIPVHYHFPVSALNGFPLTIGIYSDLRSVYTSTQITDITLDATITYFNYEEN